MSKNPKDSFLKRLEGRHLVKRVYGKSFYELNSTAILYFRFSKAHKNQFFFGVESDDLLNHKDKNLFILFICETDDKIVVIPIEDFLEMVKGTEPISNQWKVFITRQNCEYSFRVSGKGKYDVSKNLNQFDFRPSEFRTTVLPTIVKFTPLREKRGKRESIEQQPILEQLEDRLLTSSSNSNHPSIFEKTVSEAFEKLGFKVRHIGGSGNTDILVESPIKGIIDCKSTTSDSLNHLNFSRLKRHKNENNACFLLVISKGFDRAVIKDAILEKCALMSVEVLRDLLVLTKTFTVSPYEIEPLIKKEGLIQCTDYEHLKNEECEFKKKINSIMRVITSLDFKPRDLKEIKGRLDYETEDKHLSEIKEEDLCEILVFLSSPLISIAQKINGTYLSKYSHIQSVEKIKNIFKELLSPSAKG